MGLYCTVLNGWASLEHQGQNSKSAEPWNSCPLRSMWPWMVGVHRRLQELQEGCEEF